MASTDNGPPETEMQKPTTRQQIKPPLKPKPPALGLGARKLDGTQAPAILEPSAGAAQGPLVPSRRRPADQAADGDALSSSGNVRRMRELLQQALGLPEGEEAAAKEKPAQGPARSKPAVDPPAKSVPVPRLRLKRMARVAAPPDPAANGDGCHQPSVAKRPASDLHPSWEASTGLELEATREQDEAAEGPEANWHCSPTCPCMCHLERPGMVLVWRPVSEGKEDSDSSDNSLTDSSENAAKTFCYVLHVNDEDREGASENDGKADRWDPPEGSSPEMVGAEEDAGRLHSSSSVPVEVAAPGGGGPPVLPKLGGGPEAGAPPSESPPRAPVRRSNQASALADGSAPGGDARPVSSNQLPKPPRRNKPIGQSSLERTEAPQVLRRRCGQVHRPNVNPPPHIRQRYTASDLDRISKCVDGLNLHIQELQLPRKERHPPSILPPSVSSALKSLIPQITRSAPPSPKEKHLQVVYDEVDIGVDEDSGSNDYEVHLEIIDSRASKSGDRKMTNWESQFESEPLYQTYRETVINKAIKRQTLMRDSSRTSEDDVYESIEDSDRTSLLGQRTQAPGNSLWQDLSTVRQSGILNELSQRERRLQESFFEVLTSEASYLRSLNVLIEQFMNSKDLNETIIFRDKKTLFSCIIRVKEVSESFLKDLEDRMDESIKINDVCDIIYSHAQQNFLVYVDYVRNQLYQEQKYSQLMVENAQFAAAIVRLQELPRCQRLPFMSFLLLPFQRITRIKMLLENILQRSEVGSANEKTASQALGLVSKIIEECNREVGIMKQVEEMIHIGKKLEFDKLKAIPIISQQRHLEKQGEVSEIVIRGNRFGMKPKVTPLFLFLFNDLLLVTSRKSGDRYQVVDYAHRALVEVQECSANSLGAGVGNCFELILLENHQGKQSDRLVKTPTESDRHRWMDALMSGKQNLLEDSDDDKIYERWDCPQVQCLIPYTAQQADELSLDPADIINITRKSSGGWYEGCKLSSGQRGWFPSQNVREITNEHVRRRNLRDRYRLLQAAEQQARDSDAPKKANLSF